MLPTFYIASLKYIDKMMNFKGGALTLFSGMISLIPTYIVQIDFLFENTSKQRIALPIVIEAVMMFIFILATTMDAITGIQAAKIINKRRINPQKNVIQSHKLYKTTWKIIAIVFVTFVLCFFTIVCEILDSWAYSAFIWFLIWFWLMVTLFEWKSIGENLKRIDGHKPTVFMFMERLLNGIEKSGIKRINKVVGGDDYDNNQEITENETNENIPSGNQPY